MVAALAAAWKPTFATVKTIDTRLATAVAEKLASKCTFESFEPPSSAAIRGYLLNVRNSAPGVDGIPYRAWLRAGPLAWKLLHDVA
eukprot:5903204-Heterocapsa_arctica.AAC.1